MNLGEESAKVINGLLRNNLDISHLILNRNQIGDEGLRKLSKLLEHNKTIIHIDLS